MSKTAMKMRGSKDWETYAFGLERGLEALPVFLSVRCAGQPLARIRALMSEYVRTLIDEARQAGGETRKSHEVRSDERAPRVAAGGGR